jgi:Tol biopolymer transport system component
VQVFAVSPNGGSISQITHNAFSLDTSFSISADGMYLAYGYKQDVYLTNIQTGETSKVSPERSYDSTNLENINWSNEGHVLAFNRKLVTADGAWYQVFILK